MKKLLLVLAVLPVSALAAPGGPPRDDTARFDRMEHRMRLARSIGIAEALGLDENQAVKVNAEMARFDEQRKPLMRQIHDNMQFLHRAAGGDAAAQGGVDQAVASIFDARARIQAVDREMFQAISKNLAPDKKAKLAVFLAHFAGRFGAGMGPGQEPGAGRMWMERGPGQGMGRGMGPGPGPGPGGNQ
jgi:hypothetical protein